MSRMVRRSLAPHSAEVILMPLLIMHAARMMRCRLTASFIAQFVVQPGRPLCRWSAALAVKTKGAARMSPLRVALWALVSLLHHRVLSAPLKDHETPTRGGAWPLLSTGKQSTVGFSYSSSLPPNGCRLTGTGPYASCSLAASCTSRPVKSGPKSGIST